ncbi:class I SAM-dependent methyltransferase [Paenibacillus sp. P32E]|uniref:class I SAM-dependent methyltransferase n=1 Tax=Paenibacillus sp. P32E TaxID=1349434 RepID=UPI00093D594D|nr:methyltransferase domain-containing protein [Paenibacillus sp. P32E]OKP92242.1 methyltransferase type 11 [Paenibacillus sp. P32E]
MTAALIDPTTHKDWMMPHSFQWYAGLGSLTGKYAYPWNSTITGPDAEQIFAQEVAGMVPGKKVLDVGCGHGDFTVGWSPVVQRIVGLDVTADFIHTANSTAPANVSFVTANTKIRLPFEQNEFDCAYNRKGPTSAYPELTRIIRKGGQLIALHPGDRLSPELSILFPGLYGPRQEGTPVLDKIKQRLDASGFAEAEIETVLSTQYLHGPIDLVRLRCFGQTSAVHEMVMESSLPEISRIFAQHQTVHGLPTTVEYYIVRATV